TVRVEVSGLSKEEANALAEAVQKALPKGKDKKVILSIDGKGAPAAGARMWTIDKDKAGQFRFEFGTVKGKGPVTAVKSGAGKGTVTIRYIDSKTGKIIREEVVGSDKAGPKAEGPKKAPWGGEPKGLFVPGTPAPKGAGDRIDRLEKQLEAIMKELSELRKQMGRPGQGGRGFGGGFGPGGGGGFGGGRGGRPLEGSVAPRS